MTGKSGAHSWKYTFTHRSENIRGGAIGVLEPLLEAAGVVSPWIFKNESVLNPASDLPLSCILRLKASRSGLAIDLPSTAIQRTDESSPTRSTHEV